LVGAALAITGNAIVLGADARVPSDRVSYPLSSTTFSWLQAWFALAQALMTVGVFALVRSGLVAPGRAGSAFAALATVGMALTAPGELVLIAVADSKTDSSGASTASSVYGLAVLLASAGLIGYGVLALRQRSRSVAPSALSPASDPGRLARPVTLAALLSANGPGRRARPVPLAALPLVLGVFQVAVVTPVSLAAGFASTASFVVIALADLLVAAIGVQLVRLPDTSVLPPAAQALAASR
jgi:hypothetical protein